MDKISLPFLLSTLLVVVIAFYGAKKHFYPHIPVPVKVDSLIIAALAPENVRNSKSADLMIETSYTLYMQGKYEESVKAAEKAVEYNNRSELAYNNLCSALIKLQKYEEALNACEMSIKLNANFELAKGNRDWILKEMKEKQK